ncbi:ABC-type multidrug transport system, ATPase and permease component [Algoriella xinjiangensis]|uniref:ABC-type multidrug transport system, ATPase and permease component n=1 Tax=Algoriella xinjiangensis TaxID=684065 RepID=A0A1I4ZRH4_9FLAO|nr:MULTISPECIES: ABC transporter ATP-binding protein [Algoriella]MBO6213408.1 ABC transporter ATP-binding protein [Algoriella sp.]SFN52861.1 ABC-type multidrug transport system, ATPase and permease component [Algoriella xinjiangensis]VDH16321.1 Putative multidrug export ATP-binding/permease protein SAV1866 [Algoriella xinjiangensis]
MNLVQLFKNLKPFVKPYRPLVIATLLLTLVGSLTSQVNAIILQYTVDSINGLVEAGKGLKEGLKIIVFISAVLMTKEILNAFITFGQKYYGEKLRIFVSQDLAQAIIEKILTYRMAFYTNQDNQAGKLQTRIDRGIESLTRLVQNFFIDILPLFANSIVALILMFNANFYVGLVGLCIVPIYFIITQQQAKKLSGWRRNLRGYREQKSQGIISIIDSITVIKSFNREDIEGKKQLDLQKELTNNQMQTRKTSFFFDGLKSFIEQFGVVIIIILTSYLVLDGQMTIGAIMFHILLFNNVSAPIRQLHRIYDEMNDAMIYSESFFGILKADDEKESSGNYIPTELKGKFEIKDVNFSYPNGYKALKNINMTVQPNKITALVGLSGAGKSTIINLLDKFYQPDSGKILLDGIDLEEYDTQYLRENIGLVLQKNHIFNGTIEENIRYGNVNASFDEIRNAAEKAYIHEQIMDLPEQYQSKALLLSGGQQQRIAIARMFLKNPPIIFLDEPTASLDAIATEQIKNSLDAIKKDRTVIIISHSISQIIDSDYTYVMKQGEVVEHGVHEDVYKMHGTYKEIFDAMAKSLNIDKIAKTFDDEEENY